jgi:hypothetical protein
MGAINLYIIYFVLMAIFDGHKEKKKKEEYETHMYGL